MLTIDLVDKEDYRGLISSFTELWYSPFFEQLLSSSPTGTAHSASGTDFNTLIKAISASICICAIQLACFCIFRPHFKNIYQPRCYYVSSSERMNPLPKGFFAWVIPTLKIQSNFYLSMGLDAYFFVRFLNVLLLFFAFVGTLNMLILLPVNWSGNDENFTAQGLDKLSISNISSSRIHYLNAHLVMCIITIVFFHLFLIYELRSFIKIRNAYFNSRYNDSIISKTVLISNVPSALLNEESLYETFDIMPGGVQSVWFTYETSQIQYYAKQARDTLDALEKSQLIYMKRYITKASKKYPMKYHSYDATLEPTFHPPIYCSPIFVPIIKRFIFLKFPGFLRIFSKQSKVCIADWSITRLNELHNLIQQEKVLLANGLQVKHNKVFLQFKSQVASNITNQCLLGQSQGYFDKTLIGVNPEDIVWESISGKSTLQILFQRFCVTLIFVCIIILYIVPVSIIGIVFQNDFLTQVMPFFNWMHGFPEPIREILACFLPSLLLTILMDTMITVIRYLSQFRGYVTGAELEVSIQKWYYSFLFIQQFLVVTILSSIVDVFKQVVDQPTSIPVLLALNLPKAATFFFQYLLLKAFSFCGSNFLKIHKLIMEMIIYRMKEFTPRQIFNRLTTLSAAHFGTIYPIYSIYACIGIIYTIISPLIALFVIFILFLSLLYYKYALKYVFTHINQSESYGKLYPTAMFQLYTGIYCLESCLIGILFLLKSRMNTHSLWIQGWIMCLVLLATIFCHIAIYNRYARYFCHLPILPECSNAKRINTTKLGNETNLLYLHEKQLYHHPDFKYEYPKLWLPSDSLHIGEDRINAIESQLQFMEGGTTKGAILLKDNIFFRCMISQEPPDFK